jgi:ferredoxin
VLVQSRLGFRFWLPIHALGYISFILVAVHTMLAGSDVDLPYVRAAIGVGIFTAVLAWVATLRPIANLWSGREYGEEPAGPRSRGVTVNVDPGRCEIFGFCVQEAPALFSLRGDSRLKYRSNVPPDLTDAAVRAFQVCPTRAITLRGMPSYQTEQSEPLIPQWTAGPRQVTAAPVVPVPPVAPAAGYGPPAYVPPVAPAAYPPQVYPPTYPAQPYVQQPVQQPYVQRYVQPAAPHVPEDPVWPGASGPNGSWVSGQGSSGGNADAGNSGEGRHSEDRHRDDDGGRSEGRHEK